MLLRPVKDAAVVIVVVVAAAAVVLSMERAKRVTPGIHGNGGSKSVIGPSISQEEEKIFNPDAEEESVCFTRTGCVVYVPKQQQHHGPQQNPHRCRRCPHDEG